jgi:hypothetical protein
MVEALAEAAVSEAASIARANAVLDAQQSAVDEARLDGVLQTLDVLIASRRIEAADVRWLLPACGYPIEDPPDEDGAEV